MGTLERTQAQQRFVEQIRRISPRSSAREILEAVETLHYDTKAQMGRVFIARQAELTPVHICDFYPPTPDGAMSPCAYLGVAFYPEEVSGRMTYPAMLRDGVERQWRSMRPETQASALAMASSRTPYSGIPSIDDVVAPLIRNVGAAIVTADARHIPVMEDDADAQLQINAIVPRLRDKLKAAIGGTHDAIEAWARTSLFRTVWQPTRAPSLGELLFDEQAAYRLLDTIETNLRLRLAQRACTSAERMPVTVAEVKTAVRRITLTIDDLRRRCDALRVAPKND